MAEDLIKRLAPECIEGFKFLTQRIALMPPKWRPIMRRTRT